MADATVDTRKVVKSVEVDEKVINLTLTEDEAGSLLNLWYYHLAGNPHGPRKHIDAIANALTRAGVSIGDGFKARTAGDTLIIEGEK